MSEQNNSFSLGDVNVRDILAQGYDPEPATGGQNDPTPTGEQPTNDPTIDQDPNPAGEDPAGEPAGDNPEGEDPNQDAGDQGEGDEGNQGGEEGEGNEDGEGDDPEPSVIDEIRERFGIADLEGEFSDDVDGLTNFTKAAAEKMGQSYIAGIFEQYPDVQEFLEYRAKGGDPNTYFGAVKESREFADISEEQLAGSVDLQRQVLRENMTEMGYEKEVIDETLQDFEDAGVMPKQATIAHKRLQAVREKRTQEVVAQQEAENQRRIEEAKQEWQQVQEIVSQGNVKGLQIPETDKTSFIKWMSEPVNDKGQTQRQLDMEAIDTESGIALEYMYYKKFNFGNLQKKKSAAKLRDRIRTSGGSANKALRTGQQTGHARQTELPSFDDILKSI